MSLLKVLSLNSISVLIKMICLLVLNKVIAVNVGASGYATIGQFQNIIAIVITIASAGVSGSVVKHTALYCDDDRTFASYLSTVMTFCLVLCSLIALALYFLSEMIAIRFLYDESYSFYLKVLCFTLIFLVFNGLILSVINGKEKTELFVMVSIYSSVFVLMYTSVLIYIYGLYGAIFSLVSSQSVIFILGVFYSVKYKVIDFSKLTLGINKEHLNKTVSFSIMVIVPSVLWPITYSFIRDGLAQDLGLNYSGNWDGMWKFSTIYLSLITTVLSIYYLPRLAKLVTKDEIIKELVKGYQLVLPILTVICLSIFGFKQYIIEILFSEDFILMGDLFAWQLIGDFLKITAWFISYTFLARSFVKRQLIIETTLCLSFYFLTKVLVVKFGFVGVSISHAVNNFIMLIIVSIVFMKSNLERKE